MVGKADVFGTADMTTADVPDTPVFDCKGHVSGRVLRAAPAAHAGTGPGQQWHGLRER